MVPLSWDWYCISWQEGSETGSSSSARCLPGNHFELAPSRVPIMGTVHSDFHAARDSLPPLVCVALVQNENWWGSVAKHSTGAQVCVELDDSTIVTHLKCFWGKAVLSQNFEWALNLWRSISTLFLWKLWLMKKGPTEIFMKLAVCGMGFVYTLHVASKVRHLQVENLNSIILLLPQRVKCTSCGRPVFLFVV